MCGTLPLCHFEAELCGARNPKPCNMTTTALIKPFIPIWFHEMSRQRFWPLRSTARHDNLMSHSVRGGRMTWSCPAPPRAPGFGACVAPKVFSFFFDSKKEHHKNIFGTLCCTCFCACSKMTMYRAIPQTTHPILPQGIEVIFISQKKTA